MTKTNTTRAARFNARLTAALTTDAEYARAVAKCEAENAILRAKNAADRARLAEMLKAAGLRARPEVRTYGEEG